jgi:hypothetical protein
MAWGYPESAPEGRVGIKSGYQQTPRPHVANEQEGK